MIVTSEEWDWLLRHAGKYTCWPDVFEASKAPHNYLYYLDTQLFLFGG